MNIEVKFSAHSLLARLPLGYGEVRPVLHNWKLTQLETRERFERSRPE